MFAAMASLAMPPMTRRNSAFSFGKPPGIVFDSESGARPGAKLRGATMKKTSFALAGYGLFLILIGLIGYLSNPEKAKTALLSGGTFGLLNIAFAFLAFRGSRRSVTIALAVAAFLAIVFSWRALVSWSAFAGGESGKLTAAVLISSMLAGTIWIAFHLIRSRRRAGSGAVA